MQAVILAAGRGTRMGDLTSDIPKPLIKLNNKPVLEIILSSLPGEISEVILVVGYKGELIEKYFGEEYRGKKLRYAPQKELNGTWGALAAARAFLQGKFLVMYADDLHLRSDFEKLLSHDLAILAKETEDPGKFAAVKLDAGGFLSDIIEKPQTYQGSLTNLGVYLLDMRIFEYEPVKISETEFGLPQTIARMAKDVKISVEKTDFWQTVGSPEDIAKAEEAIRSMPEYFDVQ